MYSILYYIDPGSGSFIIQAIIAAVLGGWFVMKGYWLRIKSFFTGKNHTTQEDKKKNTEEEIEY